MTEMLDTVKTTLETTLQNDIEIAVDSRKIGRSGALQQFNSVREWMSDRVIKMDEEVLLILASQLTSRAMLLIGSPGCGKSHISKLAAKCYGDRDKNWFYASIQANTPADEVFGGIVAEKLLLGITEYNLAGYAADMPIAIFDEIFKCQNDDLLHKFLPFYDEESTIKSGGVVKKTKLEWSILTSNELPDMKAHEALLNRINVKRWVNPLRGSDRKQAIINHGKKNNLLAFPPKLTIALLNEARAEACLVKVPESILDLLVFDEEYEGLVEKAIATGSTPPPLSTSNALADKLAAIGIEQSQRTLNILAAENESGKPSFLQAIAWLDGCAEVDESHLLHLADCLWSLPEQRLQIETILKALDNSQDAKNLLEGILDIVGIVGTYDIVNDSKAELTRWHTRINNEVFTVITDALQNLQGTAQQPKRVSPRVKEIIKKIEDIRKELLGKIAVARKAAERK